jgi:hypothetical protein
MFLVLGATLAGVPIHSSAQILIALNPLSPVIVNSVPSPTSGPSNTGTTGEAGYEFFAASTGSSSPNDVISLPNYATVDELGNPTYGGAYTSLTIAGTNYGSGTLYSSNSTDPLVKLTLGSNVPTTFDLGILDNFPATVSFSITLYNSSGTSLSTAATSLNTTNNQPTTNNFYYTEVSGASSGDYLVITGSSSYNSATIGGITFDSVAAVPEPTTFALMLGGLSILFLMARTRYRQV